MSFLSIVDLSIVEHDYIGSRTVLPGKSGKGRLGDSSKVVSRPLDTPPPLTRGLELLPPRPTDPGWGIDEDRDIEVRQDLFLEGENPLAYHESPRLDPGTPYPAVLVKAPLRPIDWGELSECAQVFCQQPKISMSRLVALSLGQVGVVGKVVVGREQHASQLPGEGRLA